MSQPFTSKVQGSIQPIRNKLRLGSLCTGYGGLDMAVEAYFNAETIWCAEFDPYASIVVKKRINKPNLGDLTKIEWSEVEPIDILTAGYPCQPFSTAGQRKGTHDKRHIFPYIAKAIEIIRPSIIVLENVRGHLTLGFDEVLETLAKLGFAIRWQIVRASDVGAPHQRARLFIVAYSDSNAREKSRRTIGNIRPETKEIINRSNWEIDWSRFEEIASNAESRGQWVESIGVSQKNTGISFYNHFGIYETEIPNPLDQKGKLNAKFVEYMMGLPSGWITNLDLSRTQQLKILGNGVVPQQAYYALQLLCN